MGARDLIYLKGRICLPDSDLFLSCLLNMHSTPNTPPTYAPIPTPPISLCSCLSRYLECPFSHLYLCKPYVLFKAQLKCLAL